MNEELKKQLETNTLPKRHFSKEEINAMKQLNLVEFTIWYDSSLIKKERGSYRLQNDSSIVLKNNIAYDFQDGTTYHAIDYATKILGLRIYSAFYLLYTFAADEAIKSSIWDYTEATKTKESFEHDMVSGKYYIDRKNSNIFAYLCDTRKISKDIIDDLLDSELLYVEKFGESYNVLFPLIDSKNEIVGFEKNGTLSYRGKRYKGCITCEKYAFFSYEYNYFTNNAPEIILAFESALDLLSFVNLCDLGLIETPEDKNIILLSMRGLQPHIVKRFLEDHPDCEGIVYAVDNDDAGKNFVDREHEKCGEGFYISYLGEILKQYGCKDWNDLLRNKQLILEPADIERLIDNGIFYFELPFRL